jgi:hypothetical protein
VSIVAKHLDFFGLTAADVRVAAKKGREAPFTRVANVDLSVIMHDHTSLLLLVTRRSMKCQVNVAIPSPPEARGPRRSPIDALRIICDRYGRLLQVGDQRGKLFDRVVLRATGPGPIDLHALLARLAIDDTQIGHSYLTTPYAMVLANNDLELGPLFCIDLTDLKDAIIQRP